MPISGTATIVAGCVALLAGLVGGAFAGPADLVTLIDQLRDRNIGFRSVGDGAIDTTTPSGELIFMVFSALAQFERRLIQERTKAGLGGSSRSRRG